MHDLSLEKACFIVVKAREVDAQVDVGEEAEDASSPIDENEVEALAAGAGSVVQEELVTAIEELNEDEQAELVALALLGREDFSKEEWDDALEEAKTVAGSGAADYLTGMPLLGDYLENGLDAFGLDCAQLDEMNVAPPDEEP